MSQERRGENDQMRCEKEEEELPGHDVRSDLQCYSKYYSLNRETSPYE